MQGPIRSPSDLRSYDLSSLSGIREEERAGALDLLREATERQDDPRVVEALIALGTSEAWDLLLELLQGHPSVTVVTAAHLVWVERRDIDAQYALERCLEDRSTAIRQLALKTLGRLDLPALHHLAAGLRSLDRDIRRAARDAALRQYKLDAYDNHISSRIFHLYLGISSKLPLMYEDAANTLLDLLEQLDSGATVEDLGLAVQDLDLNCEDQGRSPAVLALWDAIDSEISPLDPALVEALTLAEADYAVEYFAGCIQRGDMRVLPLLAAIDTPRAALALASADTGSELR